MHLIWVSREQKYFCKRDWTGQIRLNRFNKFTISRNGGVLLSFLVCPEADRCAGLRRKRHRTGSVSLVVTPSESGQPGPHYRLPSSRITKMRRSRSVAGANRFQAKEWPQRGRRGGQVSGALCAEDLR